MATAISLSFQALLEDPNNHKEKLLTCNLEPNISLKRQKNTNAVIWESHGNVTFLVSLVFIGVSGLSQGEAVNVQFGTGYLL